MFKLKETSVETNMSKINSFKFWHDLLFVLTDTFLYVFSKEGDFYHKEVQVINLNQSS